jgi:MFS family permease
MTIFANVGSLALYLLFIWLLSAIAASYLSDRKGYGEKPGLATGLLLSAVGVIVWAFVPAREDSNWKRYGAFGSAKRSMEEQEPDSGATAARERP